MHVTISGFNFAFARNKKGKVGICSKLKELSKYNDVNAQKTGFKH